VLRYPVSSVLRLQLPQGFLTDCSAPKEIESVLEAEPKVPGQRPGPAQPGDPDAEYRALGRGGDRSGGWAAAM